MPRKKYKYPSDKEVGIRTIVQIRNLPTKELSDEEFVKGFFDRFQAKALIMYYYDQDNQPWGFGRLLAGVNPHTYYKNIMKRLEWIFKGKQNEDIKDLVL